MHMRLHFGAQTEPVNDRHEAIHGGFLGQLRLDASEGLIGSQLQFFELTVVEVPDLCLQRRFWNGSHLECQCNGILRQPAD
jgi:hypothetical protein